MSGIGYVSFSVWVDSEWAETVLQGTQGSIKIEGNAIIERVDENGFVASLTSSCKSYLLKHGTCRRFYGEEFTAYDILSGAIRPQYWCEALVQTILAAEGELFPPPSWVLLGQTNPTLIETTKQEKNTIKTKSQLAIPLLIRKIDQGDHHTRVHEDEARDLNSLGLQHLGTRPISLLYLPARLFEC